MKIRQVGKIQGAQDGASYGSELFRLDVDGSCAVYALEGMKDSGDSLAPFATFSLEGAITPHSNAVCFGSERYDMADFYPILYTNVYNNYAEAADPMIGVCCAYRLERRGDLFKATLVQKIRIGFCEDPSLWKASLEGHGVRPYGNFLVDGEGGNYYAFVMRNETLGTRYYKLPLPSVHDGIPGSDGVREVVLQAEDIKEYFDLPYHRYMQGATFHQGKIYSAEGFDRDPVNRPAIRIVDLATQTQQYVDIMALGFEAEPEMIDFWGNTCYYSDAKGTLFQVEF